MQNKTELTPEQTQQGVSDEVLNIRVIPYSIYNDDGNPTSANIKQALRQVTRTASVAAKPCQGDYFEFYLITGSFPMAAASSTTHLRLWYPKGTGIETIVYANFDHAGDYVDRKSTSGIYTFIRCCLTSWFSKKQIALAISTTEAEYVSAGKACQQALWMKQALIDYDIRLDDVLIIIPSNGACSFTDKWSLDDLRYSVPTSGPYQTKSACPDEIKNYVQEEREGLVTRRNNLGKCLLSGGNRDHVLVYLCHMLYCIASSEQYNLAYFIAKRIEFVTKQRRLILPYGMLLTRLFKYVVSESHELSNDRYVLYDRVMYPLTAQQERKTRKDYGIRIGRSSTSSLSAFGQPSSSHLHDDDNDGNDEGTSCASTPSPTHFVNSLTNEVPRVFSNRPKH
ncbi:hypothetical protein Tco_0787907 [Tanacetum coccineum]